MSGETAKQISGWTIDSLHAHVVSLLDDRDRIYQDARDADLRHVAAVVNNIETRFNGMDKANEVLSTTVNRVPTDVDRQVGQLKAVHDERLASIDNELTAADKSVTLRFQERDTRSEREARDNKTAVDAAFAAQKEAVAEQNKSNALAIAKSEAATAKQFDGFSAAVDSKFKATDDKIDDLKSSVGGIATQVSTLAQTVASQRAQASEARTQQNWTTGTIIAAVFSTLGLLISVVVAIILIVKG